MWGGVCEVNVGRWSGCGEVGVVRCVWLWLSGVVGVGRCV